MSNKFNGDYIKLSELMLKLSEFINEVSQNNMINNKTELITHLISASNILLESHMAEFKNIEDNYNKSKDI